MAVRPAEHLASLVSDPAFVTPPLRGWITVFPQAEDLGDTSLAQSLSSQLGVPCINFSCFDSDVAMASLIVAGRVLDELTVAGAGYFEEEMADMRPDGQTLDGVEGDMEVTGNLDAWISALGTGSRQQVVAAVNTDPDDPFADSVAGSLLECFGIDPRRLVMTYRFYEHGEGADEVASFIHVG